MKIRKWFTIPKIASCITVIAFIGVIIFLKYSIFLKSHIDYELFKYCFQFLLIVVLGGAVTLVFTTYTKLKEQRIKENEKEDEKRIGIKKEQHKFHNDFVLSYNSVKLLRRMFRARARILKSEENKQEIILDTKVYDIQMQELTKLQLQFEFYIDEAESNPNLFTDKDKNTLLQTKIKLMRDYLNELVTEYENSFKLFPNQHYITSAQNIPLKALPNMSEFIIQYKNAKEFKEKFRRPANDVQKILLELISATIERFLLK